MAAGNSNREALVSESTVEVHVEHVLSKLGL
jgi:DNA-binding NarL/FixJ family response regulator